MVKNLTPALLSLIPFGQFFARIFYLDGSLDKWWLLIPIFYVPPFCLVPLIMILLGSVKKGKGGKPYDSYIYLPIGLIIVKQFIGFTPIGDNTWFKIISSVLIFGSIIAILLWKRNAIISKQQKSEEGIEEINKKFSNCDASYNPKILVNTTVNSINIYMVTIITMVILKTFVFIGLFRGRIRSKIVINIFNLLLLPLALWCVYVFNNMLAQDNLKEMCTPNWFYTSTINIVILVIGILYGIVSLIFSKKGIALSKAGLRKSSNALKKIKKPSFKKPSFDKLSFKKLSFKKPSFDKKSILNLLKKK